MNSIFSPGFTRLATRRDVIRTLGATVWYFRGVPHIHAYFHLTAQAA